MHQPKTWIIEHSPYHRAEEKSNNNKNDYYNAHINSIFTGKNIMNLTNYNYIKLN